jgi:hypothetical protein
MTTMILAQQAIARNQDRLMFEATADDRGKNQTPAFATANFLVVARSPGWGNIAR